MLNKKLVLAQLQVCGGNRKTAGQLYNLFYESSFHWSDGSLGRVIPVKFFEEFYEEYEAFRSTFDGVAVLTVLPFPKSTSVMLALPPEVNKPLLRSTYVITTEIEKRFEQRIRMLEEAVLREERFNVSLLEGLKGIVDKGIYLEKIIDKQLLVRLKTTQAYILTYTADDIRRSTSAKEDVLIQCGALLCG